MEVRDYTPAEQKEWDAFVDRSRNGTFLFRRDYMDYHSDRFVDASLMLFDSGELVALLPANVDDDAAISHGGLTYGGFITGSTMTTSRMLEAFDRARGHYAARGLRRFLYKTIPWIYASTPSEEDRYALFLHDARLYRRDVLSVFEQGRRVRPQERRSRSIRKAAAAGLVVEQSSDFAPFWEILTENLSSRYGVAPVHSLAEIELLRDRFPDAIQLVVARRNDEVLAGAVVYLSGQVCHVQYNAASKVGKTIGALDLVLEGAIDRFSDRRYFDFGISTERNGRFLNAGLVEYKEGFGARTVVHDYYELTLTERPA